MGWSVIAGQPVLLSDLPGMWVVGQSPALPTGGQGLPVFSAQPVCGVCTARYTSKPGLESHVCDSRLIPQPPGGVDSPQTTWSKMNSPLQQCGLGEERPAWGEAHSWHGDLEVSPGSDTLLYWEGCAGEMDMKWPA